MISEYRKSVGGVDHFDQRITYYAYPHKYKKWWKYFFNYLIEIAINNAYIIFREVALKFRAKDVSYIDFRLSLIKSLTQYEERMQFKASIMQIEDIPIQKHVLIRMEKAKLCDYCKSLKIHSNTAYSCSICKKYLHSKCMDLFHNPN